MARNWSGEGIPNLVLCGVPNEKELLSLLEEYRDLVECYHFIEPDLNNEYTAFCTKPVTPDKKRLFRKLKLIKI